MKLILTGSIAIDRIMSFPGKFAELIQPDKLHVLSISILLNKLEDTRGGIAANIAYGLAQLGEKPVLYGSVGHNSREYMDDLANLGVDTQNVHYSELPTASFTVMTDQADCQVGGFYPGAMGDASSLDFKEFTASTAESFFVISPHDPAQMSAQVEYCAQHKARLFYDVGQQATNIAADDIKAGIKAAELLIVNDYEMGVLVEKTGWSQAEIISQVKTCVITLGEKGCKIYTDGTASQIVPANIVTNAADPTGAGDAFRAGFLFAYLKDLDLTTCAQLGSTLAAYAIEKHGTQTYSATLPELLQRCSASYDTFKASQFVMPTKE
jgi:adenosine kinase